MQIHDDQDGDAIINEKAGINSNSGFVRDAAKLVGGTAFAQGLAILASPILTRLYGPEAYGISAMFIALTSVAIAVACFRYEMAIMLPKRDEDAQNLLSLSIASAGILSVLTIPILWLQGKEILHHLGFEGVEPYLWMAPIYIFLSGTFMALNYWNTRSKQYSRLSSVRVAGSISTTGAQLSTGLAGHASGGSLIAGNVLGSAVSTMVLGALIWRESHDAFNRNISFKGISRVFYRYKRFPIYDTWSTLLNTISWLLPTFLLSQFFSTDVIGYFALSMTVLQMPMNLIGSSVAQVFFQRASEAKREGRLATLVESTAVNLWMLGILPILILSLAGVDIFSVIFGARWAEAGEYTQIMALWIFAMFITSPISTLFSVFEKQRSSLILNLITLPIRASALIIGGLYGDPRVALGLFSAIGIISYSGVFVWLLAKSGISMSMIFPKLAKYLIYCLPIISIIMIAKIESASQEAVVAICCIGAILYFSITLKNVKL